MGPSASIQSVNTGMGKAGKWSVFLQEECVYQRCRELKNAYVVSAAANRADEQEAHLHGQSELQSRARRSKPNTARCSGLSHRYTGTYRPSREGREGCAVRLSSHCTLHTPIFLILYNTCITQCRFRSVKQKIYSYFS
jgi:hypothetical protein